MIICNNCNKEIEGSRHYCEDCYDEADEFASVSDMHLKKMEAEIEELKGQLLWGERKIKELKDELLKMRLDASDPVKEND